MWLKRTLFLEFPMYVFVPEKHSKLGRGEGNKDGQEWAKNEDEGNGKGPKVDVDGTNAVGFDGPEEGVQEDGPSTGRRR